MLDSCADDCILIQTVKSMVTQNAQNELESDEEFFLVSDDVQDEQQNVTEASNQEAIAIPSDERMPWSALCRVCANTSDHLIPIFDGEGLQHDLCNKLHKYLPIRVSENDALPLQLCYHCAATLLAWHELLEGCLNAERRLLQMQVTSQEKQGSEGLEASIQDTSVSNVPESPQQQQETVKDEICEEMAVNDSNRSRACADLDVKSESSDSLDDQHSEREDNDSQPLSMIDTEKFISSESSDDSSEEEMIQPNDNLEAASEQRDELARSKITVNGSEHYQCDDCGKILSSSYNFLVHRNTHRGGRPCTCHVCNESFLSVSGLNRHMRNVHAEMKQFSCEICGRCLASEAARDEHRRTHKGERLHQCETCGKLFKKSFETVQPPRKCPPCEQSFRRKQERERQLSKQRLYPCDVCGKQFRNKGCISRHMRVHNGDRGPCVCTVCGARFTQQRYLESHRKNLHPATRSMA